MSSNSGHVILFVVMAIFAAISAVAYWYDGHPDRSLILLGVSAGSAWYAFRPRAAAEKPRPGYASMLAAMGIFGGGSAAVVWYNGHPHRALFLLAVAAWAGAFAYIEWRKLRVLQHRPSR